MRLNREPTSSLQGKNKPNPGTSLMREHMSATDPQAAKTKFELFIYFFFYVKLKSMLSHFIPSSYKKRRTRLPYGKRQNHWFFTEEPIVILKGFGNEDSNMGIQSRKISSHVYHSSRRIFFHLIIILKIRIHSNY